MVFQDFLDFLVFLETSEVAGPGPNPREIEISFGADGPLACVRGPWARQEHLLPAALRPRCCAGGCLHLLQYYAWSSPLVVR